MSAEMVERAVLDEAIRIGNSKVLEVSKYMRITTVATDAIHQALEMLKCGRVDEARNRLERALLGITRLSKP